MREKIYHPYLLELLEPILPEEFFAQQHQAFSNHLRHYREPDILDFPMWDGLNLIYGQCLEADFADAIGGYAIPFYQKWGVDSVRGRILYDLCVTDRPADGGDLVLITQFYAELIKLVRDNDI